jgi:hypothetical protein
MRLSLTKAAHANLDSRDVGFTDLDPELPVTRQSYRSGAVASHISRKTSEIWGTRRFAVRREYEEE